MELFSKLIRATVQGLSEIEITDEEYNRTVAAKKEQDRLNEALTKSATLNNIGIAREKEGDIDGAIECYEQNIGFGVYQTTDPYDRLLVIYRKRKDYENELRVTEAALNYLCERYESLRDKYEQRKQKILLLNAKQ